MAGFRKAERKKAKLRLGLVGPSGSGKTYSALLVAFGLGGRVAMIDTESGSGDLYDRLGDYDVWNIDAPYTVQKYLDAINMAERAEYDTLIIDSLSHAWAGEGGLLDQQGKIADSSSSKNSYTAWRTVTPLHYKLIEAMLTSKCHIIATMRAKTEYSQEKDDRGKTVIKKLGLAPVQREGMDYEFTLVFDVDANHNAMASKDRTSIFDGQIQRLSQETGQTLKGWLESGTDTPAVNPEPQLDPKPAASNAPAPSGGSAPQTQNSIARKKAIYEEFLYFYGRDNDNAKTVMMGITEGRGSKDWTLTDLMNLEAQLKKLKKAEDIPFPDTFPNEAPCESARDVDEDIDLAEKMGIGPDPKPKPETPPPMTEVEKLRIEVQVAFGPEGLGYTVPEREAWIEKYFHAAGLKALKKDELKKCLAIVRKTIKDRDAAELGAA
jgi:hypothetical protein